MSSSGSALAAGHLGAAHFTPLSSLPLSSRLGEVAAALAGTDPAPQRVVLFGSRARGEGRPDSDLDLLVIFRARPKPST